MATHRRHRWACPHHWHQRYARYTDTSERGKAPVPNHKQDRSVTIGCAAKEISPPRDPNESHRKPRPSGIR